MMPYPSPDRPAGRPPSLHDTDELLGFLATFPRCPEVTEVLDDVLDFRARQFGRVIVICYGCAGSRTDPRGGPCRRCGGSGIDTNP